jgi:hypothetical protein
MWAELKALGDLRAIGRGEEYEDHPSADFKKNHFYERYMRGELLDAGWVIKSDYEKEPLKLKPSSQSSVASSRPSVAPLKPNAPTSFSVLRMTGVAMPAA